MCVSFSAHSRRALNWDICHLYFNICSGEPWWTAKLYHTAHSLPLLKIRGWEKIIEERSAVEEDGNYSFVISHGQNGFSVEKLIQFIDDYYKNRAMKN